MVVRRHKKVTKYRAYSTHGGGARKKRRGAGSHGGRGRAGSGKRAGHHKQGIMLGKKGFFHHNQKKVKAINVGYFTTLFLRRLLTKGQITKEGELYVIDLSKMGFQKLLGTGTAHAKMKILTYSFTAQAEEKIKAAGGRIESLQKGVVATAAKGEEKEMA